jgi:hypothetical protein
LITYSATPECPPFHSTLLPFDKIKKAGEGQLPVQDDELTHFCKREKYVQVGSKAV